MTARNPAANKKDKLGRDLVLRWRQYLVLHGDGSEDLGFVSGWILNESGGDPCSTGGGNLDEIGIVQFNVPKEGPKAGRIIGESGADLGFTRDQIVAACHIDGSPPTEDEADVQAAASMALVRDCVGIARHGILAAGAIPWIETSVDFWSTVKLEHASGQAGVTELLPLVARSLSSTMTFAQFRAAAIALSPSAVTSTGIQALLRAPSKQGHRNRLDDCFVNAMDTATYIDGSRAKRDDNEVEILQVTLDAMTAVAAKHGIRLVDGRWQRLA